MVTTFTSSGMAISFLVSGVASGLDSVILAVSTVVSGFV